MFSLIHTTRRFISREVAAKIKEKRSAKNLALEYFDFFYSTTYLNEWNTMRLALLTGSKYVALVNNYSSWKETEKELEAQTALNMFEFVGKFNQKRMSEDIEFARRMIEALRLPRALKIYTFDSGDATKFPAPRKTISNLMNYYCMDGASVLPVLALDIQKDDEILDLCASPGGKTLVMLQTMLPKRIVCRDQTAKRLERLATMLGTYLDQNDLANLIEIQLNSPDLLRTQNKMLKNTFDKVLVDVPCTNDRDSLFKIDNNIFSKPRSEERSALPKKQIELLTQGVMECKMNGTIVYSTCSLSPMQNEGVVSNVLNMFKENTEFSLTVEPLDYLKHYFEYFFTFSAHCKQGLIVAPDIKKNFGPFYLCKLKKSAKN